MNKTIENPIFIIAEAGVNHDGDYQSALRLIDIAKEAQADAVKFQTFKPGEITGKFTHNVRYLEGKTNFSRYELSNKLSLPYDDFRKIQSYCEKKDILFLSTPDGIESLDFLVNDLGMPIIKVGSSEITHHDFLKAVAKKNKPVILSTGLSYLGEIEKAYYTLKNNSCSNITVLQCTSEYPAPDSELNLEAINTLRCALKCPVGFSDHSIGKEAALMSVALGVSVIEKHFTDDKTKSGPDHSASLDGEGLYDFVKSVRRAQKMLGTGIKAPSLSELSNLTGIRRGIVASINLEKGVCIEQKHIAFKRPYSGIDPELSSLMLGKKLLVDLLEDQPITWEMLE